MTISAREAIASASTTQLLHSHTSSPTRTPSPFMAREWSIADSSPVAYWTGDDDPEAWVIDRICRLSWRPLEPAARSVGDVWIGAGSSASPAGIVITVLADDLYLNPREALYNLDETREEEGMTRSHSALLDAHRLLQFGSSAIPLKTVDFTALAGDRYPDLRDALHDLDEARDEAREEGFPAPSDTALGNARRLLHAMYGLLPCRFEVYPTPDGEIAVHSPAGSGRSVLVLCGSDGGVLCFVNMNGAHRRARYSDAGSLPDGFIREALAEL